MYQFCICCFSWRGAFLTAREDGSDGNVSGDRGTVRRSRSVCLFFFWCADLGKKVLCTHCECRAAPVVTLKRPGNIRTDITGEKTFVLRASKTLLHRSSFLAPGMFRLVNSKIPQKVNNNNKLHPRTYLTWVGPILLGPHRYNIERKEELDVPCLIASLI